MKTIEAYQCADGLLFDDEGKAKAHDDDLLGQELDGLLKQFQFGGTLSRNDEYRGLLRLMNNRAELKTSIISILRILEHGND